MESNQFEIYIDYDKDADNPERVFLALADIVSELSNFDKIICESLAIKVESKIVLDKVESGSVRAFFTNVLEHIDDESLKKLDWHGIVGSILVDGKYLLIDALKEKPNKQNVDIKQLQEDIFQLSKPITEGTLKTNNYIPSVKLAKTMNNLNIAFGHLTAGDKIKYMTKEHTIDTKYNPAYTLAYEKTQLIEQNMVTNQKVTLVIKKPDLLGDSQWEFKFNGNTMKAKIEDENWLTKFQNGDFSIQAKDSIECDLRIETNDIPESKSEVIYTILKVHQILKNNPPKQLNIKNN